MYYVQPLASFTTGGWLALPNFLGATVFIGAIICLISIIPLAATDLRNKYLNWFCVAVVVATPFVVAYNITWKEERWEYKNIPVNATYIGNVSETSSAQKQVGKHTQTVYTNTLYVSYKIDATEEVVTFIAVQGKPYPMHGILYKN